MREELALQEFELDEYEELDFDHASAKRRRNIVNEFDISNIDSDFEIEESPDRDDFDRFINEYNRC